MNIDMNKLSPMMRYYVNTKEEYKDSLLMCRLGDFYELFFDDAVTASKVLDIALTGRNCGLEERAPMCGVPYHAVDSYVARLIEAGYKVAIIDQMTEPMPGKMVERSVTRVITPGTIIESDILSSSKNNYLLSIYRKDKSIGVAYCDVSTGEFKVSQYDEDAKHKLVDLLTRVRPAEIICNEEVLNLSQEKDFELLDFLPKFTRREEFDFDYNSSKDKIKEQFSISSLQGHDFASLKLAMSASGALLIYLVDTQKRSLGHINKIVTEQYGDYMSLDFNACRNLELIENAKDRKKKGSLLGHLNKTKTAMGARLLEKWILQPLQNSKRINTRLDCVEELVSNGIMRNDLQIVLSAISDIERLTSKISYGNIGPKECVSLKNSLFSVVELSNLTKTLNNEFFKSLFKDIDSVNNLAKMLDSAFIEDAPQIISNGGFIKSEFNKELFELRNISTEAGKWLTDLESREREDTGIKNLKIGYSRVFGYFIEINKSQVDAIPYRYERRQTISNHERYSTPELKELEAKILNAKDTSIKLENTIFEKIKEQLKQTVSVIQKVAMEVSYVDVLLSLAIDAVEYGYVRPQINERYKHIKIVDGRHPIVEHSIKDSFVPNDAYLDEKNDRTLIITGPNMAGKSTYMRQIALIVIMAHMGSFVPCSSAEIAMTDRIFTRIGASDDLNSGQSTFMVEMVEVANILNNATSKSLVLLDEVGRGTATYDGMSIAWAVLEYISTRIRCKTLFSTHYHEITMLEGKLDGVRNYKVSVKEFNNSIIFLRKVVKGSADRSFGIEVASLSGIYDEIIKRAKNILFQLEKNSVKFEIKDASEEQSLTEVDKNNIINEIRNVDVNSLSPLEAFELITRFHKKINS